MLPRQTRQQQGLIQFFFVFKEEGKAEGKEREEEQEEEEEKKEEKEI